MASRLARQLRSIKFDDPTLNGTVVFECIRKEPFFEIFCLMLSFFFVQRNIHCYILKDDGWLNHIDVYRKRRGIEPLLPKVGCLNRYKIKISGILITLPLRWLMRKEVNYVVYKDLLGKKDLLRLKTTGLEIDAQGMVPKNVDASHKRFFGGRPFDPKNDEHVQYGRLSMGNQAVNEEISRVIVKKIKPDLFVTIDGIYSCCGSLADEFKRQGVDVLVYQPMAIKNRSVRLGTIHACVNNIQSPWPDFVKSYNRSYYEAVVKRFFDKRLEPNEPTHRESETLAMLKALRGTYEKVICLFPNITWDGAIKERDTIFNGVHDWLLKTIEWAAGKPYLIVIREHPQPSGNFFRYDSILKLLKEINPALERMENLVTINALNPTQSYRLIREVGDLSVVYNGTLGLEIAYMRLPVIFAGNSPYTGKGIGFEPVTRKDYFDLLIRLDSTAPLFLDRKKKIRENAIRAGAYEFYYNTYYVPIMPVKRGAEVVRDRYWRSWETSLEKLDPMKFPEWNRTLERFLFPWTGIAPGGPQLDVSRN